ncbi:uncharacterized protein LOC132624458 [Lycium barbarum]|uniref:uncharacterized protein LOC132624458 n=1 Tax=Lycium barbarum TaxID=112863 RepID=UPI00293E1443|nr:uncharacterized protein LOC132624458 [Lycium barbarum]
MPSTYAPSQVRIIPNPQLSITATPFKENKQNELAICPYTRPGKQIKSICHEDLGKELHDLRKAINEKLRSRNFQGLKYEDLCVHPYVELPQGHKIPNFNTFNGEGDPVTHLKDYCSRLIGIGHDETIRMRLFSQSLSRLVLTWYTKQDFSKCNAWEDMARGFIKQYEFNVRGDLHIADLLKLNKMLHESFQEDAIQWRLEASKYILHCLRELESGIQEGRIVDSSATQVVHQNLQSKIPGDMQNEKKENKFGSMTMHQAQCHQSHQILQSYATMQRPRQQKSQHGCQQGYHQAQFSSRQQKKMKSFSFTPLDEPLSNILERLSAQGILQPKKGFIPKHPLPNFDLSKSWAYRSNIQGHDTQECLALRFKIQSIIENGKIKRQQEPPTSNDNITNTNAIIIKGDPSKLAPRPLKRKRATTQED